MMTFKHLAKLLLASVIDWHVDYLELQKITQKKLKRDLTLSQRGFHILKLWKTKNEEAAENKNSYNALVHNTVQRKDLAEKYCFE